MPDYTENRLIVRLRGFDAAHYARTKRYARQVERLYNTACDEIAAVAGRIAIPEDGVFSFDDFPATRKQAQGILTRLAKRVEAVINTGTRQEWEAACDKSDTFLNSILRTSRLTPDEAKQYQARNLEALQAFQQRKAGGLGLSQRVWKYTDEFKTALELGIDVAVGEGRSAQQLSRDLRSYLQAPDKLFRRVRDKGGNLRLSKAAKMYHPGQGVYRSSAKNAERLARTEVNMAYREAEYLRWQQLDFVVGFRVMLSNNHTTTDSKGKKVPLTDICDELAGDYPKTFKFLGWHPQCRCVVVPIMADYDEYNNDRANRLKAIVRGQTYKSLPSRRTVRDVPAAFRSHIETIADRAKGWKSMPYYIRDNFKKGVISGGLLPSIPQRTQMPGTTAKPPEPCTEYDSEIAALKAWAYTYGLNVSALDPLRTAGDRAGLKAELQRLQTERFNRQAEWIAARNEVEGFASQALGFPDLVKEIEDALNNNEVKTTNYYGDCISRLKAFFASLPGKLSAAKAKAASSGDKPHPALIRTYTTEAEIDTTFKKINKGLKGGKWFENGDLKLGLETKAGNNGSTWMDGRTYLTASRLKLVKSALGKIAAAASDTITESEADAMATFWHEITHNRNKPGNMRLTTAERRYMELANEFVARKTLPEFYGELGCAKTPQDQFINNRASTGYNGMVKAYDSVITKCSLDADKVLDGVRKHLYNEKYTDQLTGLKNGLIAGGLKHLDGTPAKPSELNKILTLCKFAATTALENYLRTQGFIK